MQRNSPSGQPGYSRAPNPVEPQIENLQRADDFEQPHERAEHQRGAGQHFGHIDDRREPIEMRQNDVVDEIRLRRDCRGRACS